MSTNMIDALRAWGCDTVGALHRMAEDAELYEELLTDSVRQEDVELLEQALQSGDVKGAFNLAHAAKGVYGNLGVTPLYRPLCQLTDALRGAADCQAAQKFLPEVLEAKHELIRAVLG